MTTNTKQYSEELDNLCLSVKEMVKNGEYDACKQKIYDAMGTFPHAPHPHNLIGVVLEKLGDHMMAMKHFRAAWALDPTYPPANHNLNTYGTFFSSGNCAFDESDIPAERTTSEMIIQYDNDGVGHLVKR